MVLGWVVGHRRLIRELGRGGMGTVYLAENLDLPRREAVKVLSAGLSADDGFRSRFLREADVAASLDHPNIVSIYDRGEYDGRLWIAMEFVDGVDALHASPMPAPRAVHVITEIGKALDYAHARGVIHRDVKPANFLLSGSAGPQERVLLGDFGIARAFDDVGLTVTGAVLTTMAYAAPESFSGAPVGPAADVYSLGCSLFRLLTGRVPFADCTEPAAMMYAHLYQPVPTVSAGTGLPPAFDDVLARAMAKDPAARYPNAAALAAAAAAAAGMPPHPDTGWATAPPPRSDPARPNLPAWPAPARPPGRRRAVPAALAAAAIVAVLAAGGVWLSHRTQPTPAPAPTEAASAPPAADPAAPALVPGSAAATLLPSPAQLAPIFGVTLTVGASSPAPLDAGSPLQQQDCLSAWGAGMRGTYSGSGFTGFALQVLTDPAGVAGLNQLVQAVAVFPTPTAAQAFIDEQTAQWRRCATTVLVEQYPGKPAATINLSAPITTGDGIVTMMMRGQYSPAERQCQRGLTAQANVVIDVEGCARTPTQAGADVAEMISATVHNR